MDPPDAKDPTQAVFTDDPVKNFKLALHASEQLQRVFQAVQVIDGVLHGGCVRELYLCKTAGEYLTYLQKASLLVTCVKLEPSLQTVFTELLKNRFKIEGLSTEVDYENLPLADFDFRIVTDDPDQSDYDSDDDEESKKILLLKRFRTSLGKELKPKKGRTSEEFEKLLDIEMKNSGYVVRMKLSSGDWHMYVEFFEANNANLYMRNGCDFNINSLMMKSGNFKMSLKPKMKLCFNHVVTSIKRRTFKLVNRYRNADVLFSLYGKCLKFIERGYQCDFSDNYTRKTVGLILNEYLSRNAPDSFRIKQEVDFIKTVAEIRPNFRIWKQHTLCLIRTACGYNDKEFLEYILLRNRQTSDESTDLKEMLKKYFGLGSFEETEKLLMLRNRVVRRLCNHSEDSIRFVKETHMLELLEQHLYDYSKQNNMNQLEVLLKRGKMSPPQHMIAKTMLDATKSLLVAMAVSGDINTLTRFIYNLKLQKKFILDSWKSDDEFVVLVVSRNKLDVVEYWLSLEGKLDEERQQGLICLALSRKHVDMAELLKKHGLEIYEHDFDDMTVDKFTEIMKDKNITTFLDDCPSFKLSEKFLIKIFKECNANDIEYFENELAIFSDTGYSFKEIGELLMNLLDDYQLYKNKILCWIKTRCPTNKRACWVRDKLYDKLIKEHTEVVSYFLEVFTLGFAIEMVFYNCAISTKELLFITTPCTGRAYVYADEEAKIAWRLQQQHESPYGKAILELLFTTKKFTKLGNDIKGSIGAFL